MGTVFNKNGGGSAKVVKLGTYSSVSTINVSPYKASSSSEFLAVLSESASVGLAEFYWQNTRNNSGYQSYSASISPPSLSLSGTMLTITPAKLIGNTGSSRYAPTEVYYVGKIK